MLGIFICKAVLSRTLDVIKIVSELITGSTVHISIQGSPNLKKFEWSKSIVIMLYNLNVPYTCYCGQGFIGHRKKWLLASLSQTCEIPLSVDLKNYHLNLNLLFKLLHLIYQSQVLMVLITSFNNEGEFTDRSSVVLFHTQLLSAKYFGSMIEPPSSTVSNISNFVFHFQMVI